MDAWDILEALKAEYQQILGRKLTGIYVHGSLVFGCYRPEVSDIDFVVVVNEPPLLDEKKAMIESILRLEPEGPKKGMEMSVVLKRVCTPFVYPTPFELHYSAAHAKRARRDLTEYCTHMNGVDPDLAAHFTVMIHKGKVLCGRPIAKVFAPVPREHYLASLRYDVENACEDIKENPVYIVLNLCRIAAYQEQGLVLSKAEGGIWGIRHLPGEYADLIRNAFEAYTESKPYAPNEALEQAFAREMLSRIFAAD